MKVPQNMRLDRHPHKVELSCNSKSHIQGKGWTRINGVLYSQLSHGTGKLSQYGAEDGTHKRGNLPLEGYELHLGPHAEVQTEKEILERN